MGKVWVLDTETKGTGAEMVPLERVQRQPDGSGNPTPFVPSRVRRPRDAAAPARCPRRFKVVDVMTERSLGEDLDGPALVEVLRGARRSVDVRVAEWDREHERWRVLTLREQAALWALRDRSSSAPPRR